VISRGGIAALLAVVVVLVGAPSATSGSHAVAGSIYVVRPDPRLCPSPLCGGYWVSLANHARTPCHDSLLRPRCYVTDVFGERGRSLSVPADGLVRATLGSHSVPSGGRLGELAAAEIWAPAGVRRAKGDFFRVSDTGLRCIRFPCPTFRVERLNGARSFTATSIDLLYAQPTESEAQRAERALSTTRGLLVLGSIVHTSEAGRIMQATRLYLISRR